MPISAQQRRMKCLKRVDCLATPVDRATCHLQAREGPLFGFYRGAQQRNRARGFIHGTEINGLLTAAEALLILRFPDIFLAICKESQPHDRDTCFVRFLFRDFD